MVSLIAILIWPVVVFWLFASRPPASAVAWSILGGYLLLPAQFALDLPGMPTLDKNSITALSATLAAAAMIGDARRRALPAGMILPGAWPRSRAVRLLLALLLIGTAGMVLTNGDALSFGRRILPGLRVYDLLSVLGGTLFLLLPFLLARKYLAHPEAQRQLLVALALAGLGYSLPALYEVRMSPQLSLNIYGYFPHDWIQHLRAGGFRPVVFLHHGLWLAIFFCSTMLAAMALWRSSTGPARTRWLLASGWLFMTLVLSKGTGALGIGLLLGAAILFLPVRLQVLGAAVIAGMVLTYPMLRGAGLSPIGTVLEIAGRINAEREGSLQYRLDNEDILLDRANQRPVFGWGTWGRNRVYDSEGRDISVTDGFWAIQIGEAGWSGYLAKMGLLTVPLLFMALRWRSLGLTPVTAGVALALTANLIDLIPNATLTPVTWLLAGALAGRLELGRVSEGDQPEHAVPPQRRNAYSRQVRRHPAHVSDPDAHA